MSEEVLCRKMTGQRLAWRRASAKGRKTLSALLESWQVQTEGWYADNTRETLRDETFRKWRDVGVLRERAGVPKNSSRGRWALEAHFADLFDPRLTGESLELEIEHWRASHLSAEAKLRVHVAMLGEANGHSVSVTLPNNGGTRELEAGQASLILKSVIEDWIPRRLKKPFVLTLSEPGNKLFTADAELLRLLDVELDVSSLLPDALVADLGEEVDFWFIEAVNTDGEIDDERKSRLLDWASHQGIDPARCSFLSAFSSRNSAAARRRLKDIAVGSFAYFADEPGLELAWRPI
ncbi:BsuBI/PstI family type II restriction endonuclease [Arthrobacter woluwensis]|uniref:BsuBI/PstI family type II restriction endonuclease n=1 Tax=Arthrobacter woluwensis TaxID=156980 RepID=UPI001C628390|nr:BsuBI/PstI family type II restriction endonuclease [Arthrobacter woluwensis]